MFHLDGGNWKNPKDSKGRLGEPWGRLGDSLPPFSKNPIRKPGAKCWDFFQPFPSGTGGFSLLNEQ